MKGQRTLMIRKFLQRICGYKSQLPFDHDRVKYYPTSLYIHVLLEEETIRIERELHSGIRREVNSIRWGELGEDKCITLQLEALAQRGRDDQTILFHVLTGDAKNERTGSHDDWLDHTFGKL